MARPRKEIDQKQFENLCGLQCTLEEICGWFDVCSDTLETWCKRTYKRGFSEVFAQKRGAGKISLRRSQWRLAEKNATMAIFLGKQFLGQRDSVDVAVTDAKGIALDELEKMVMQNDADTSGGTADT
nr:MAG TPA: putative terminase small subunit [Caudoviricetes sp.]